MKVLLAAREVFLDMRRRGLLAASDASVPEELQTEIESLRQRLARDG